jgi:hypothetical protein
VQRRKWRPKVKSSYLVTNQLKTRWKSLVYKC